jgi:hypothetical protein
MVLLPLMLIWLRDPMYFNASTRWAMVAFAATVGLLAPELGLGSHAGKVSASDSDQSQSQLPIAATRADMGSGYSAILREGTHLKNRVGQFSRTDGGWFFAPSQAGVEAVVADGTSIQSSSSAGFGAARTPAKRIRVLENLALQRVAQMIQQDPSDNRWMISGTVTEFFGENRLLVVLAVRAPIDDAAR